MAKEFERREYEAMRRAILFAMTVKWPLKVRKAASRWLKENN